MTRIQLRSLQLRSLQLRSPPTWVMLRNCNLLIAVSCFLMVVLSRMSWESMLESAIGGFSFASALFAHVSLRREACFNAMVEATEQMKFIIDRMFAAWEIKHGEPFTEIDPRNHTTLH